MITSDKSVQGQVLFVLEDLDDSSNGFAGRRSQLEFHDAITCVRWLAGFHRAFLNTRSSFGSTADLVWDQGSYWSLATRPDELAVMEDSDPLKSNACALDGLLSKAIHKTLIHGDAKPANFCFGALGSVAAVDFQYTGWGVGVIDVAYCLGEFSGIDKIEENEPKLIDEYFSALGAPKEVELEWRQLYSVAVADF